MITKKEYFKKRTLYFTSFILIYFIPSILILTKLLQVDYSKSSAVKWNMAFLIVAIVMLFVILRFLNKKIKELKPSCVKPLITGLRDILPFVCLATLSYIIEKALEGINITIYCVIGSMAIGYIMQSIEHVINKQFLYEYELQKMAKEDVDREKYKEKIKEELETEKELNDEL